MSAYLLRLVNIHGHDEDEDLNDLLMLNRLQRLPVIMLSHSRLSSPHSHLREPRGRLAQASASYTAWCAVNAGSWGFQFKFSDCIFCKIFLSFYKLSPPPKLLVEVSENFEFLMLLSPPFPFRSKMLFLSLCLVRANWRQHSFHLFR